MLVNVERRKHFFSPPSQYILSGSVQGKIQKRLQRGWVTQPCRGAQREEPESKLPPLHPFSLSQPQTEDPRWMRCEERVDEKPKALAQRRAAQTRTCCPLHLSECHLLDALEAAHA